MCADLWAYRSRRLVYRSSITGQWPWPPALDALRPILAVQAEAGVPEGRRLSGRWAY